MRLPASAIAAALGCSGAALGCFAVGLAGPALADDSLNGHYQAVVNGSPSNSLGDILNINSSCDPDGNCTGWVSTPKTWGAPISKSAGASWTIRRTNPTGWTCADGSKGAAELVYSFAPASLAGTITATKVAGACGDPTTPTATYSLNIHQCVDDPRRGVCPS
ncbi:hypothetical protein A5636_09335 [Mycobacterium asiaticum]|uniref:Secreted protein n=2 Tax=Mycobacterium asiaticum TaxID=1790 RepID=A0A1A3MVJ7_MYCAS|nr:hypothetical protein A5636_09335 [Mycobacterium asiaticum]